MQFFVIFRKSQRRSHESHIGNPNQQDRSIFTSAACATGSVATIDHLPGHSYRDGCAPVCPKAEIVPESSRAAVASCSSFHALPADSLRGFLRFLQNQPDYGWHDNRKLQHNDQRHSCLQLDRCQGHYCQLGCHLSNRTNLHSMIRKRLDSRPPIWLTHRGNRQMSAVSAIGFRIRQGPVLGETNAPKSVNTMGTPTGDGPPAGVPAQPQDLKAKHCSQ